MPQQLWHLTNNDLFRNLQPEQLERLESRSRSRAFPARSPVYLPSQSAENVFLLASGLVKVCSLTNDGKQSILALLNLGSCSVNWRSLILNNVTKT